MTQHPQPPSGGQEPHGVPPIIINNAASSSASAVAGGRGHAGRRRQSVAVHVLLFLLTAGIGNVLYALHVSSWNRRHGY